MNTRFFAFFLLLVPVLATAQNTVPPVGAWREHLPYGSAIAVAASDNTVFCATPFSLFSVSMESGEVQRFSKVSGLSETGVSTLGFDAAARKLVVAYSNGNIDVLSENKITNIPDLKRENIAGDKTVYQVYPSSRYYYLATGLGVIVLDLTKAEIKDSWFIGEGGSALKVNAVAETTSHFYAATDGGLKKFAPATSDGADFRSWQTVPKANGSATLKCESVAQLNNNIFTLQQDSLFTEKDGVLKLFYTDGWPFVSLTASEGNLLVCERRASGESRVVALNNDGSVKTVLQQPGVISFPKSGIQKGGVYWVADLYGGLSQWSGGAYEQYKLNAPEDIATGALTFSNGVLYAAAGSVNEAWNYLYNGSGVYQFKDEQWTSFNRFRFPQLDSLLDFLTVAVDPRDGSVWGGSYGGGLLHILPDNTFQIYKQASPIGAAIGDPGSYRVSGLAFDHQNNLWVANYGAAPYLHVLKNDGTWQSFTSPFPLIENEVAQIVVDDLNQKWIVAPKGNGLILFHEGASLENTADDQWRLYKAGAGNGNLPASNVLCVAKDHDGFIWVGTADGAAFIPCVSEAAAGRCEATLPVIQEGGSTGYLFKGEAVQSIAIDGANQKWMGTKNGAWLLNADGDKVLQHFTEANSPLLSNDVRSIAVKGRTGEVFFATAKGICSFRGTATEAAAETELVLFPNPVPPGYGGTIAIRGVPENSIVRITELNGRLVHTAKASGGQAVWNGRDYTGKRISTGVYLVLVTGDGIKGKRVGKLVFISK